MKPILCSLLAISLSACAGTRATSQSCYTQANVEYFEWHGGANPSLIMRNANHSTPTRAGGSVIGTAGTALVGAATAFATKGLVH